MTRQERRWVKFTLDELVMASYILGCLRKAPELKGKSAVLYEMMRQVKAERDRKAAELQSTAHWHARLAGALEAAGEAD